MSFTDFYNKQSEYNALTGKDASRAHATWSLDPKDLIPDLVSRRYLLLSGNYEIYAIRSPVIFGKG